MSNTKIKAGQFYGVVGNGTNGYFLVSDGNGGMSWVSNIINPTITNVDYPGTATAADPAGGESITLTGTGFKTGATVTIGGTAAPSVSYVSATQLTITTPAKTAGDYDIVVTNTDTGSATYINGISYNGIPAWTTAAGSLGTFASGATISTITLQASEPDAGTITFNITNGALPTGLSLTGANIDGTTSLLTAETLYTFTVTATDDENQATPRTFTITVKKEFISTENFTINTYTGNGSTQSIEGKIGTAASFNGSTSKIVIPSDLGLRDSNSSMTFSAWIKFDSIYTSSFRGLVGSQTSARGAFAINMYGTSSGITTSLERYYGSTQAYSSTYNTTAGLFSYSANTWYHLAIAYDGSTSTVSVYVDGSQAGSSYTLDTTYSQASQNETTIGLYGSSGYGWIGKIDQVRIFNKEISSSEASTLASETYASTTKSITDIFADGSGLALYEFEKGAIDTGGTSGYIGSGGIFNTNNSRIVLGSASSLVQTNFTFSAWVKTTSTSTDIIVGTDVNPYYSKVSVRSEGDGRVRCLYGNYTSNENWFYSTFNTINDGNWHHIVYFINQSTAKLYIDGTIDTTHTLTITPTTNGNLILGSLYYVGGGTYYSNWEGTIDQVRIFNKELSSSEVTTLYGETSASATKSTTDIFNDGSGVALYEFEGNANDSSGYVVDYSVGSSATSSSSEYIEFGSVKSSGKYYWEVKPIYTSSTGSSTIMIGIQNSTNSGGTWVGSGGYYYYGANGQKYNNGSGVGYGATYIINDIIGVALDLDNNTIQWYKNGTLQGANAFTGLTGSYRAALGTGLYHEKAQVYFDTNDWTYSAPSGYSEWTDNLTATHIYSTNSSATTYNGTATNVSYAYDGTPTNVSFVGTSFQPDLVWAKCKDLSYSNVLIDSVRGTGSVYSNLTSNEDTLNIYMSSLDSNGFTLTSLVGLNSDTRGFVAWCWKAGGTAVSNTNGTITSTVSANQDAGFSIVKYTANGTSGATIGHGLSQELDLLIVKSTNLAQAWNVYVKDVTNTNDKYLRLNQTDGILTTANPRFIVGNFSSTVFSVGNDNSTNGISGTDQYISYCFHSVDGYQKIGSYNGTGVAGNVQTLGFAPRWLMIKRYIGAASNWVIFDTLRIDGSGAKALYADLSNAEGTDGRVNLTSTGFDFDGAAFNESSTSWIYLAIA